MHYLIITWWKGHMNMGADSLYIYDMPLSTSSEERLNTLLKYAFPYILCHHFFRFILFKGFHQPHLKITDPAKTK